VIVSDIPVFREIYGQAAVYFNQNDPSDIAKKISSTIFENTHLGNLVKEGYDQARLYSWKKTIEDTVEVYKKMAASI
jgi:glycosyltransferase involved in cell wall biosynthesis